MATTDNELQGTNSQTRAEGGERSGGLRQSASDAYEAARQRTSNAYGAVRQRASSAYSTTRDQTAAGFEAAPLAAVLGGFAIGALVAGLLPRTERENRTFGAVGNRINTTAREAAAAARNAGRDKLDELGLNRDGISERLGEFASSASAAIRNSRRSNDDI